MNPGSVRGYAGCGHVLFLDQENLAAADSRVALLARMRGVMKQCLTLLGLEAPERM